MRFRLAPAFLLLGAQAAPIQFAVPNSLLNTDGNDASLLPFSYLSPVRYQQVYDASQFTNLPTGGAFLSRIYLTRVDCSSRKTWLVTNLQVNVSTTIKGPDSLSAEFAQNIGSDEVIVYRPGPYAPSLCGTFFTGNDINVTNAFFYDPTKATYCWISGTSASIFILVIPLWMRRKWTRKQS